MAGSTRHKGIVEGVVTIAPGFTIDGTIFTIGCMGSTGIF